VSKRRIAWAAFRRAILGMAAVLLILLALSFSAFRILLPELPQLQRDIEALASQAVGKPLVIGSMDAVWGGWGPKLIFYDVSIRSPVDNDELVGLQELSLGTHLLQLLSSQPQRPAWVDAKGLRLVVEQQPNGLLQLRGFSGGSGQRTEFLGPLLDFLAGRGTIALDNTEVLWQPAEGSALNAEFSRFDVAYRSGGGSYHIELSGRAPASVAGDIELVLDAKGRMDDLINMKGEAFGHVEGLQFHSPWIQPLLKLLPVTIQSGLLESGDFSLRWNKNQTTKVTSHLILSDIRVAMPRWKEADKPYYTLEQFTGDVSWQALNDNNSVGRPVEQLASMARRWNLVSEQAQLTMAGETATMAGLDVVLDWREADQQSVVLRGKLARLNPNGLFKAAEQLPMPSVMRQLMAQLQPDGELSFDQFRLKQTTNQDPQLSAQGKLKAFRWNTGKANDVSKGWPGVKDFSSEFSLKDNQVRLDVDSHQLELSWPWLYRESRLIEQLKGPVTIAWRNEPESGTRVDVNADELLLRHRDAQAVVELDVVSRPGIKKRKSHVKLKGQVDNATIDQVKHFIPAFTPESAENWLQQSLQAGDVTASIEIDGPVVGFPYPDKQGVFRVDAHASNAALEFAEAWPQVEQAEARVQFENLSMRADVKQATTAGIPLQKLSVTIPDLRDTNVHVMAGAESGLPDLLAYVRQSPLYQPVASLVDGLSAAGKAKLDLNLLVPAQTPEQLTVNGELQIEQARLQRSELLTLDDVNGEIRFTRDRVVASDMRADFHGFTGLTDLDLSLTGGDMLITADSQFDPARQPKQQAFISELLPAWFLSALDGSTAFKVDLSGYQGAQPAEQITITSALQGLAVDAPLGLAKPAEQQRPMKLVLDLSTAGGMRVTTYAKGLGGADLWVNDGADALTRAEFSVGNVEAVLPAGNQLGVAVDVAKGDLDEILLWFEQRLAAAEQANSELAQAEQAVTIADARNLLLPDELDYVRLRSDEFTALGIRWHALNADIQRDGEATVLSMQSVEGSGSVRVPDRVVSSAELLDPSEAARAVQRRRVAETIDVDFDYLYLPDLIRGPTAADGAAAENNNAVNKPASNQPLDPREFPVVKATIRDGRYMGVRLGEVELETLPGVSGLVMQKLKSRGGALNLDASGRWDVYEQQHFSELKVNLQARNWDAVLTGIDLPDVLNAKSGRMRVDLQWPGPMTSFNAAEASGGFSVDFADGLIYKVEPGVAKILGLFSFYSLPRRLLLDFSDVAQQGLSFDKIKGDFVLNQGNAWTDNLIINAPGADARIVGRAGIIQQDYDQRITIRPQLGGGTAVVGALVSGIGVGALLLIGNEIFGKPFDELGVVRMHLTGSWEQPLLNGEPIALDGAVEPERSTTGFGRPGEGRKSNDRVGFRPRR